MFIRLRIWLLNYGKKGHIVFPLTVSLVENKFTAIRAMDGENPGFPVDVKLDQTCDCSACWGNDPYDSGQSLQWSGFRASSGTWRSCYHKYPSGELATWMSLMYAPKTTPACSGLFHIYQVRILRCKPTRSTSRIQSTTAHSVEKTQSTRLQSAWKTRKTLGSRTEILNLQESFLHISKGLGRWICLHSKTGSVSVGLQDRNCAIHNSIQMHLKTSSASSA